MRKSILLASFLFATSAFSDCGHMFISNIIVYDTYYANWDTAYCSSLNGAYICTEAGDSSTAILQNGYAGATGCVQVQVDYASSGNTCPAGTILSGSICEPIDHTCNAGYTFRVEMGGCYPTLDPPLADPMNAHNNDQTGCKNAGGYYFADGSCNGGTQAIAKIFQDPAAVVGAMLSIGGITFSGTGVLAAAAFSATPVGAVTVGTLATLAGVGSLAVAAGSKFDWSSAPSPDVTSGETRIKVNLTTSGGSAVTSTNTTTGKVDSVTTVPPQTLDAMKNSGYVDVSTGTLTAPIPLDGTQTTNYDYGTNTATTTTHEAGSISSNPITTTKTTPITVTQNPDGTVTTTPTDTTVAPTVSGSGGGSVVSPSTSSSTVGTGTGTGGSTGNGPDYTGVLNDIRKNTGDSSSFLDKILGMFNNTDSVDTSKASGSNADGHEGFDGLKGDLQGSFDGFVFTDPLGLNGMGGAGIASYGFTMLGHHYVILDQAMIDLLPLSLLRGLFLFLAAFAGLITVVSGV